MHAKRCSRQRQDGCRRELPDLRQRIAADATINLGKLGTLGLPIFGADTLDLGGRTLSSAGDVNGDGFDDLLVGAYRGDASSNAKSNAGESYVIFGRATMPTTIDLANLGTAGITIFGAEVNDYSGISISSAGDVNGDGFDDLLIGAYRAMHRATPNWMRVTATSSLDGHSAIDHRSRQPRNGWDHHFRCRRWRL